MMAAKHNYNDSYGKAEPLWVVFWTILILLITLYPYYPLWEPGSSEIQVWQVYNPLIGPGDFLANVLLFIPWGFFLASILAVSHVNHHRIFIVLVLGAALTGTVESLQMRLPSRHPAPADIFANLLGVIVGAVLEVLRGNLLRSKFNYLCNRILKVLTIRTQIGLHMILVCGLFWFAYHQSSLSNWDPDYYLNLGNERTGDRPWRGSIGVIRLWDTILPREEIDRMQNGETLQTDFKKHLVWRFDPSRLMITDSSALQLHDMVWQPAPPGTIEQAEVGVSEEHWLTSSDSFLNPIRALRQAKKFTLDVTVKTGDVSQAGPGRIVSLSEDPAHRNFTLGQDGPDLVFRLRTPSTGLNGISPALYVQGVFSEVQERRIVITYCRGVLTVYLGAGESPSRLDLRYGGVFRSLGFSFEVSHQKEYFVVFWGVVVIPFIYLLLASYYRRSYRSKAASSW